MSIKTGGFFTPELQGRRENAVFSRVTRVLLQHALSGNSDASDSSILHKAFAPADVAPDTYLPPVFQADGAGLTAAARHLCGGLRTRTRPIGLSQTQKGKTDTPGGRNSLNAQLFPITGCKLLGGESERGSLTHHFYSCDVICLHGSPDQRTGRLHYIANLKNPCPNVWGGTGRRAALFARAVLKITAPSLPPCALTRGAPIRLCTIIFEFRIKRGDLKALLTGRAITLGLFSHQHRLLPPNGHPTNAPADARFTRASALTWICGGPLGREAGSGIPPLPGPRFRYFSQPHHTTSYRGG